MVRVLWYSSGLRDKQKRCSHIFDETIKCILYIHDIHTSNRVLATQILFVTTEQIWTSTSCRQNNAIIFLILRPRQNVKIRLFNYEVSTAVRKDRLPGAALFQILKRSSLLQIQSLFKLLVHDHVLGSFSIVRSCVIRNFDPLQLQGTITSVSAEFLVSVNRHSPMSVDVERPMSRGHT